MNKEHPKVIDDHFEVLELLGEGVSGQVFKVRRGQELWALKLLKSGAEGSDKEEWIDGFKFEFSLLKDIIHPHVVRIGDFGWDRKLDQLYFTEELINGTTLDKFLADRDPEKGALLFTQCLEGLAQIHQAKALHGDIKPNNIYVTQHLGEPWAKILDLGIAHPRFHFTAGTPPYFAPERLLKEPIDERSDLYSLAVTFYECLTGFNPFKRKHVGESLKAQTSVLAPDAGSLNPKISPHLNRILSRLMAKNPSGRYRNAMEVLCELDFERGLETSRAIKAPFVTEKWVGRTAIRNQIRDWVKTLKKFSVLIITGKIGIGKTRLLQEIKYEFELEGHTIRTGEDLPAEKAIYIWDDPSPEIVQKIPQFHGALGLIVAIENGAPIEKIAKQESIPEKNMALTPMTLEDLREIIILTTQDENPPHELVSSLFQQTEGHPGHTIHLLSALCHENKLIGPHGEWNLAPFREGVTHFLELAQTKEVLEDLLTQTGKDQPEKRARLLLQKVGELLRSREEVGPLLKEIDKLIHDLPHGEDRIFLHANFLEKKGWRAIQEGNFDQAKRELEGGKTLLSEMKISDPILNLRISNFQAYILIHERKLDRAIVDFEKTHGQWKKMNEEEQKQVVNNDLGIALMHKGQYGMAIQIFEEYLVFYETLTEPSYQNRCHYNLGECLLQTKSYDKALIHYQKAADGARVSRQWDLLLRAYNGMGNAANHLKNTDTTLAHYQRALDLARYLKDYAAAAAVAQNMGVIQKELNQNTVATKNLELSLNLIRQIKETTPHTQHLRARALMELGQLKRVEYHHNEAKELLIEAKNIIQGEATLKHLQFWVLHAMAQLALDENRAEEFTKIYPDLLHHAENEEQKNQVEFLKQRSPIDPTLPRFKGKTEVIPKAPLAQNTTAPVPPPGSPETDPLKAILEITHFLNSEHNLVSLFSLILKYACHLSSAESGLILLLDDESKLFVAASKNIEVDDDLSQISQHIAGKVLSEGRALRCENAMEDEEYKNYRSVMSLGLKSIHCVPVRSQGKIMGVLYLVHRFQAALFESSMDPVLQTFADQAGLAIENARMISKIEEQKEQLQEKLTQAEEKIESYRNILKDKKLETRYPYSNIIANSEAMDRVFSILDRITSTNLSVLIRGESGTGKELIARALHYNSTRKDRRFVAVNCGAIPTNLMESEMFGYKAGAFTGASRDKKGLFEEATGGTLFLDEIGELDLPMQVKLLRALQEKEIVRVGDSRTIPVDVRIVAATLKNLTELIKEGKFREDLFYRIAEIQLELPPLRDRREDIPLLVEHFVKTYAEEHKIKKIPSVDKKLMRLFVNYSWPGNIRELSNRVRVATALCNGKILTTNDLPDLDRGLIEEEVSHHSIKNIQVADSGDLFKDFIEQRMSWREIETLIMARALKQFNYDVIEAARILGIGQATLYNRLRKERLKEREAEFEELGYQYPNGSKLDDIKREVFQMAYQMEGSKPYHAARRLGVSPGMFYKWVE